MNREIDLKKMEKSAWKTYYAQDGLYDIFFGIMVIMGGLRTLTDIPWFTLGILAGVLVVPLGKRYITTPRIGRVKFGRERMGNMMIVTGGIGIAVVITSLIFFLTVYSGNYPRLLASFLIVAMIVSVFALMAYYLDHLRLFFYGILIAAHEFIWVVYGRTTATYYNLFLGIVLLFIGFLVLIKFLKKYPKPKEEANYI
jgi:hypothetical protein